MSDENDRDAELDPQRRRVMARSVVVAFAAAGAALSAAPLPIKDAAMLSPIEVAEINALADVYAIPRDEDAYRLMETTVGLGLASTATSQLVRALEGRLRSRISAGARSALVAAGIVAAVGIATGVAFDRIHAGELTLDEIDLGARVRKPEAMQRARERVFGALERVLGRDTAAGLRTSLNELLAAFTGGIN